MFKNPHYIKSLDDLKKFLSTNKTPLFFCGSRTSTVINYEKSDPRLKDLQLVDLSRLESKMELTKDGSLLIKGPVTWENAREYLLNKNLEIMTAPTEEMACILAGLSTSATGERAFGLGTLRDQVVSLKFLDSKGFTHTLESKNFLFDSKFFKENQEAIEVLEKYNKTYTPFSHFKNAPFPRLLKETDLVIGFEGQLGPIVEATIRLKASSNLQYFYLKLDAFEKGIEPHLEIFEKIQEFRGDILSCEYIDSNSLGVDFDGIYLEVEESKFSLIYENFFSKLELTPVQNIFELSKKEYKSVRENIPRKIHEYISRNFLLKKGTDTQVLKTKDFRFLLELYRDFSLKGIKYQLFGHFGDGHLHFNFLPDKDKQQQCDMYLEEFYDRIQKIDASPFAEHGIGIVKKKFIEKFYKDEQWEMFLLLKEILDPDNNFFPTGFMNKARIYE